MNARLLLSTILAGLVAGTAHADPLSAHSAQQLASSYSVKPSDVAVPDDVPLGEYRRTIRPYKNWTLICDENLKKKQRVCNVSQNIVDENGTMVFSWSLAATAGGAPLMIVRVPATVGANQPVRFSFGKDAEARVIKTMECDQRICLAMLPVSAQLKALIAKGVLTEIFYLALPKTAQRDQAVVGAQLHAVTVRATLEGLSAALSGI